MTIDLSDPAERAHLLRVLDGAELWAVGQADGSGTSAEDAPRAALEAGAALCLATVGEASASGRSSDPARPLVPVPKTEAERPPRGGTARADRAHGRDPGRHAGPPEARHGMGQVGSRRAPQRRGDVVGLMSHSRPPTPIPSSPRAGRAVPRRDRAPTRLTRHLANSAGASAAPYPARRGPLRDRALRAGAVRDRSGRRWARAGARLGVQLAQVKRLAQARRRVRPAVRRGAADVDRARPVGYADGFRRDLTELRSASGTISRRWWRRSRWTRSRSSSTVSSPSARRSRSSATECGEAHAAVAGTINYELVTGIRRPGAGAARLSTASAAVAGPAPGPRDEPRHECLRDREEPVPARDEHLALPVLEVDERLRNDLLARSRRGGRSG